MALVSDSKDSLEEVLRAFNCLCVGTWLFIRTKKTNILEILFSPVGGVAGAGGNLDTAISQDCPLVVVIN